MVSALHAQAVRGTSFSCAPRASCARLSATPHSGQSGASTTGDMGQCGDGAR